LRLVPSAVARPGRCSLLETPDPAAAEQFARDALAALASAQAVRPARSTSVTTRIDEQRARLLLGRALDIAQDEAGAVTVLGRLLADTAREDRFWPYAAAWYARSLRSPQREREEGRPLLLTAAEAFESSGELGLYLDAQMALGWAAEATGDLPDARQAYEKAQRTAWLLGDFEREFDAVISIAAATLQAGDYQIARRHLEEALNKVRTIGFRPWDEIIGWQLLTRVCIETADLLSAEACALHGLASVDASAQHLVASSQCDLAEVRLLHGDRAGARDLLEQAARQASSGLARLQLAALRLAADPDHYSPDGLVAALGRLQDRHVATLTELAATVCRLIEPCQELLDFVRFSRHLCESTRNRARAQILDNWLVQASG
jgi:tetratricopeptide (TPR) repeat protein